MASLDSNREIFEFLKSPPVVKFFSSENPSKSEGVQILEWIVDLLLIHPTDEEKISSLLNGKLNAVQNQLQAWRYPQATSQDQQRKNLQLPWPSAIQNKFSRRGDRSGFDLRLFVAHPSELKKIIHGFERVLEEWNNP